MESTGLTINNLGTVEMAQEIVKNTDFSSRGPKFNSAYGVHNHL